MRVRNANLWTFEHELWITSQSISYNLVFFFFTSAHAIPFLLASWTLIYWAMDINMKAKRIKKAKTSETEPLSRFLHLFITIFFFIFHLLFCLSQLIIQISNCWVLELISPDAITCRCKSYVTGTLFFFALYSVYLLFFATHIFCERDQTNERR